MHQKGKINGVGNDLDCANAQLCLPENLRQYEPCCEKTGLRCFRPGPTLTVWTVHLQEMARVLKFPV